MTLAPDLVWYVAYGSNVSATRFRTYIEGGFPPGRSTPHRGARDSTLWQRDSPVRIPHQLFFSGQSITWDGGGVAFVEPSASEVVTFGRAYLLTAEQFQDVLAQESGREVGTEIDLAEAIEPGHRVVGSGKYDRVVALGPMDGLPMFTFTTPDDVGSMPRTKPSPSYLETITAGLIESHGLTRHEIEAYLSDP